MQAPRGKLSRRLLPARVPALLAVVLRLLLARIPAVLTGGSAVAGRVGRTVADHAAAAGRGVLRLGLLAGVAAPLLRLLTGLRREGRVVGLVLRLALGRQQPIDLRVRGPAPYPDDEQDDAQERNDPSSKLYDEGSRVPGPGRALTRSNACRNGAAGRPGRTRSSNARPGHHTGTDRRGGHQQSQHEGDGEQQCEPRQGAAQIEFSTTARDMASRVIAYEAPTIAAYPRMTPRTSPRPGTGLAGMPKTLDL